MNAVRTQRARTARTARMARAASRAPRPGAVLAALAAAQFTVMLATSIVNVALPQIRSGAGLSDAGTTWVVNAYGLAFGALLLAGGRLVDLLGRRRVLIAGLVLFAAASAAAGLAASSGVLITARAVQGLGAAAIAPASLALAMELFPAGPGRGRALGVWGAVSGAGGAAGVLLGGAVTQAWGWPWIFHSVVLGTALVLVAVTVLVPPGSGRGSGGPSGRFDVLGTATVTLALTCLVWGLTTVRGTGWSDARVMGALGASAVLLAAFAAIEVRSPDALVPPRLLRAGRVAAGNLLMALLGSVWIALFFFLPLYQQQVLGSGPLTTGAGQLPFAAANMFGSVLAPLLARRIGARAAVTAALLTEAAGLLWLSRLSADGSYAADVLGPSVLVGLGLGAAFVQITAFAVEGVRPQDAGLAGGLVNTTRQVGGAIGLAALTTLAGSVTAHAPLSANAAEALTAGYRTAFAVSAAVPAVAAALAVLLTRRAGTPSGTAKPTPTATGPSGTG
ncbi:MFS transporter [Streptomyces sp. NPDC059533]|uniref:MFS transporter n=1 Tax=Streptomyces sp. NPDC059533 TaxID=3346858 RepID=UPI003685D754